MKNFCSQCGVKLVDGNSFCVNCGKSIGRKSTEQIEHTAPVAERPNVAKTLKKKKLFMPAIAVMAFFISAAILFFVFTSRAGLKGTKIKDGFVAVEGISIKSDIANGEAALSIEKANNSEVANGAVTDIAVIEYKELADKEITISIPADYKNNKNDHYMIGIGTEVYSLKGSVERLYRYYDVTIENKSATLTFNIKNELADTVYFAQSKNDTGKRPRVLSTAALYKKWAAKDITGKGHFRIFYPQKYEYKGAEQDFMTHDETVKLMSVFEEIYDSYVNDYNYEYHKREDYPMDIHIEDLGETDGYFRRGLDIDNAYIALNTRHFWRENKKTSDLDHGKVTNRIKSLFAHEFFHFVQANYYNPYTTSTWFGEATASYFESLYLPEYMDSIDVMNNNWKKVYDGIFPASDGADEGYARMPVIEFLVNKKGGKPDFIREIYKTDTPLTHNGWTTHIIKNLDMKVTDYAVEFYSDLITKKVRSYKNPAQIYDAAIISSKDILDVSGVCIASKVYFPNYDDIKVQLTKDKQVELTEIKVGVPSFGARLIALDMLANVTAQDKYPNGSFLKIKHSNECDVKIVEIDQNTGKNTILQNDEIPDIKKKIGHGYTYLLLVVSLKAKETDNSVQIYVHGKVQDETINTLRIIPNSFTIHEEAISKVLSKTGILKTTHDVSNEKLFNYSIKGASVTEKSDTKKSSDGYTLGSKNYTINGLTIKGSPVTGGECSITASISYNSHSENVEISKGDYFNVEEHKNSDSTYNTTIAGKGRVTIMQTYDNKIGNYKKMTLRFDQVKITGTKNNKQTYKSIHPNKPELNKSEVVSDKNDPIHSDDPVILSFIVNE